MKPVRSTWTDDRLDDLKDRVDSRLSEMSDRIGDLGRRVDHQSGRIDALQHAIIGVGGGLVVAIVGLIATQI